MMCESIEQRICIKFCFKIGKTATESYQLLQQAYGEDAMGRNNRHSGRASRLHTQEGAPGAKQNNGHVTGVF